MQRSLLLFEQSIKSENTRKLYRHNLEKFLEFSKIKDLDSMLKVQSDRLQVMLEDYLFLLKKKLSPNTIPVTFAAIEHFFIINDVNCNFKKLHKMYPAKIKKTGNKDWSTLEIQKMLRTAVKKRTRALILFLSSTGCRVGIVEELKLKHLTEMPSKCKSILFYEGSTEEYIGFLTPEASIALNEYLEERKLDGENINPESPVFREGYKLAMLPAKHISKQMTQSLVSKCIKKAGIKRIKSGRRFDVQQSHGFRKHFNKVLKLNNNVNSNIAEKLMGHKNGLDGVYLNPTKEECFKEFQKAIIDLTIEDTQRLATRNSKLEEENLVLEKKSERIEELERRLRRLEKTSEFR